MHVDVHHMRVQMSSQPSPVHGKLGGKSAAESRTIQAFPDLRGQNAIISDACGHGGAITLAQRSKLCGPFLQRCF